MASGTLVTRVFTGRAELPIAGASVSVVKKDGDRLLDLLTVRVSDRGGDTEAYVIETPEADLSQSPGNPAPYALVDLWVDRQGFQLLHHLKPQGAKPGNNPQRPLRQCCRTVVCPGARLLPGGFQGRTCRGISCAVSAQATGR